MTATAARYSLKRITPPTVEPVSVAEAKQHLRIVNSDEDTLIESYIAAAREWVETFTNRTLVKSTWQYQTDGFSYYCIDGDPYAVGFRVPRAPLISVSSITYLDEAGAEQTLSSSYYNVDPNVEPGLVSLAYNQTWPNTRATRNAVTVTYLAGYGARTKTLLDLATVLAGQTVIINGLTFTAHSTTTTVASREFSISGSNSADATALASCINDSTYGVTNVVATVSSARITLTPYPGTDITATPSAATITVTESYECTAGESVAAVPYTIKHAIKLLVNHWYENREPVSDSAMANVPMTVETLLWSERILEF